MGFVTGLLGGSSTPKPRAASPPPRAAPGDSGLEATERERRRRAKSRSTVLTRGTLGGEPKTNRPTLKSLFGE